MQNRFRRFFVCALVIALGCNSDSGFEDPGPPKRPTEIGKAQVWITSGDQSLLLTKRDDITITEVDENVTAMITLHPDEKLQVIEGFGAALTGSSAYLIHQKMSASQRSALLKDLFDPDTGIGLSYLRMTIGASDFSLEDFTYNDLPSGQTDYDLEHFSIEKDQENVVPVFKQILDIAPDVRIMGSPWSPPAWMKTNGSLRGGRLKPEAYDVYARYFVKYIQAYGEEGIAIDAVTPQNEPLYFTANYPCMEMQSDEQLVFIRDHLGPAFEDAGFPTKIVTYDHNWDNPQYAINIMNDATAKSYVAGSAFHAYAGDVSAMSVVHNAHPDRGLYFTEISGGRWATNFGDNLMWNMSNIFIGTTRNWSKTVLLWNLALDENDGPKNNGCQDCRGVVTINSSTGAVTRNVEYYSLAHFSKFVRPGAVRIASSAQSSAPEHVAFINPDGSTALILSNSDTNGKTITVESGAAQFEVYLGGRFVATVVF